MGGPASLVKRGTPSLWPDEIGIILDESDPLYQPERLELPVTDEHVRNFVAVGQVQPIAVRVRGEDVEAVDGCQRHKRASVINAVVGARPYRGKLESVREAIERIKANADLAAWLSDQAPNGVKLKFDLFRGKNGEAARAQTSANEMRTDDPLASKIRRAHRMAKAGFAAEDIAADFGHPDARTVKRWLKKDPEAAPGKPGRKAGAPKRPGAKTLAAVRSKLDSEAASQLLGWALGEVTAEDLVTSWPELAGAFEKAAKKAKAA